MFLDFIKGKKSKCHHSNLFCKNPCFFITLDNKFLFEIFSFVRLVNFVFAFSEKSSKSVGILSSLPFLSHRLTSTDTPFEWLEFFATYFVSENLENKIFWTLFYKPLATSKCRQLCASRLFRKGKHKIYQPYKREDFK